tara:strand:+ start:552 stop:1043 length:492 start_codon:yes stop_codon:yes gene_type:complete
MGLSKEEAMKQLNNATSNQQALVKKLRGTAKAKPVKHIIPAGKTMAEDISEKNLPTAIFNWLRHCRHFTEAEISLCKDVTNHKTKENRIVDFDTKTKNTEWELRGKRWLAERIADVLTGDNILAVKITKEGLTVVVDAEEKFSPSSEDWEPYIQFTPFKPPTF